MKKADWLTLITIYPQTLGISYEVLGTGLAEFLCDALDDLVENFLAKEAPELAAEYPQVITFTNSTCKDVLNKFLEWIWILRF